MMYRRGMINNTHTSFPINLSQITNRAPPQKVLVTGGTGFLGAYIIQNLLTKGIAVRALRRSIKEPFFISKEILARVEWVDGDILDVVALSDAMQEVTAVIHSAAVVSFSKGLRREMYQVNIEGTANTVNAAIESHVSRFVHVSSVAALGRTKKNDSVSEEKRWEENKNNTHYAITKHKAEIEMLRGFAEGLEGVIVNPSTILGYGDWHNSSCAIFKSAYKEFPWYSNGINGFVGVEDAAEAIVQLVFSKVHNRRYIINAENLSFKTIFESIADGFNKNRPSREATPLLGEMAWRIEAAKTFFTKKKQLITSETARIAQCKTEFANKALLEVLPHFTYTPVEKVIKDACKKYLNALQKGELTL
ncbi:MAG TPA: NAD-dependent epimerase/dehydratase family protein [Chitinophagaceae bacterium]|nr:NAD-dependent epimerase/dehydratase family protein [Chitinophagaceae bacterium]